MSKSSSLACDSCMRRRCYDLRYLFVYTEQIPTRIYRLLSQIDRNPRERLYASQGVSMGRPQSSPSAPPSELLQFTGKLIALRASNKPNPDEEVFVLLEFGDELERETKVAEFQKVTAVFGKYVVHPRVRPYFEYHAHFNSDTQSILQLHTPRRDLACASKPYRLSEVWTPRSGTLRERYQDRRHCSRLGKGERCKVWYHQRRWAP